mmetsp:Transcript_8763/g.31106  ORF Transcript_8763/g.31106 Transcript_8763/m.31106 type:complete len:86 (-) Transcript_8763:699-956(-)
MHKRTMHFVSASIHSLHVQKHFKLSCRVLKIKSCDGTIKVFHIHGHTPPQMEKLAIAVLTKERLRQKARITLQAFLTYALKPQFS